MSIPFTFGPFRWGVVGGICAGLILVHYLQSSRQPIDDGSMGGGEPMGGISGDIGDIQPPICSTPQSSSSDDSLKAADYVEPILEPAPTPAPPPTLVPTDVLDNWLSWKVLEERLTKERIDLAWASQMEGRILNELAAAVDLTFIGMQIHCRTSMCRIEVLIDDRSRSLGTGMTGDALIPAVQAAMRTTNEHWFIPAIASSSMPLESRTFFGAPRAPARTRAWIAYVFDKSLVPSTLPDDLPKAAREVVEELRIQAVERWLEERERNAPASEGDEIGP